MTATAWKVIDDDSQWGQSVTLDPAVAERWRQAGLDVQVAASEPEATPQAPADAPSESPAP